MFFFFFLFCRQYPPDEHVYMYRVSFWNMYVIDNILYLSNSFLVTFRYRSLFNMKTYWTTSLLDCYFPSTVFRTKRQQYKYILYTHTQTHWHERVLMECLQWKKPCNNNKLYPSRRFNNSCSWCTMDVLESYNLWDDIVSASLHKTGNFRETTRQPCFSTDGDRVRRPR